MKITMLGTTGSGKTVYTSAMADLFYHADVDGYKLKDRDVEGDVGYNHRKFSEIGSLAAYGTFPEGTNDTTKMDLVLTRDGERIINIDWIDYRGGAINELAGGMINDNNRELYAELLASDVIMVFVDAALLKALEEKNASTHVIRARIGANHINAMLNTITQKKKNVEVMFLLSKFDSSTIDRWHDYYPMQEKVKELYGLREMCNISYKIFPIGAVGYGNATTTVSDKLIISQIIENEFQLQTINIASSFATALLMALESAERTSEEDIHKAVEHFMKLKLKTPWYKKVFGFFLGGDDAITPAKLMAIIEIERQKILGLQKYKRSLARITSYDN